MSALEKLVALGSPIRPSRFEYGGLGEGFGDRAVQQLLPLMQLTNGLYAFESALHIFADAADRTERGLLQWNAESLWRSEYAGMTRDALFFAEDVFGVQFCIQSEGTIASFDPETAQFEPLAASLEEWARAILDDYQVLTGYEVAHAWQLEHGALPAGTRLVPITPFVLGGDFSVANVHALDAVEGMRYRASLALQIRDLPDGATVRIGPA